MKARLASLMTAALVIACAGQPAVTLSSAWPTTAPPYDETYRAWTRHAILRNDYEQALELHATFKSPAWRAAHVDHVARKTRLSAEARNSLMNAQRKAASEAHEFQFMVSTYQRDENDLNKGERSIWRIVLRDDRGNEVEPLSIQRDRRPRATIREEFPDLSDFAVPYVVSFPASIEILRPDATRMSVTMGSMRGAVELVWSNQ